MRICRPSLLAQKVKNLPAVRETQGLIPGSGSSPGEGNGYPLQYSDLENSMNREAWWATVHGVQRVRHDWVTNINIGYRSSEFWRMMELFWILIIVVVTQTHLLKCVVNFINWKSQFYCIIILKKLNCSTFVRVMIQDLATPLMTMDPWSSWLL